MNTGETADEYSLQRLSLTLCFSAGMTKATYLTGAIVAAFAAPLLLAAPASALPVQGAIDRLEQRLEDDAHLQPASYRHDRRHLNRWNQTPREVHRLTGQAIYQCESQIEREAHRNGFRSVRISDRQQVTQTGRYRFEIGFRDVSFRAGRNEIRSRVRCDVVRGNVTRLEGIPRHLRPGRPHSRSYY